MFSKSLSSGMMSERETSAGPGLTIKLPARSYSRKTPLLLAYPGQMSKPFLHPFPCCPYRDPFPTVEFCAQPHQWVRFQIFTGDNTDVKIAVL